MLNAGASANATEASTNAATERAFMARSMSRKPEDSLNCGPALLRGARQHSVARFGERTFVDFEPVTVRRGDHLAGTHGGAAPRVVDERRRRTVFAQGPRRFVEPAAGHHDHPIARHQVLQAA